MRPVLGDANSFSPGGVQFGNFLFPNPGVPWQPGRGDFGGNTVVLLEDKELGKTVEAIAAGVVFCIVCFVLDTLSTVLEVVGTLPSSLVFLAAASVLALAVLGCPLL